MSQYNKTLIHQHLYSPASPGIIHTLTEPALDRSFIHTFLLDDLHQRVSF